MANYKIVIPTSDGTVTGGYQAGGTDTDFVFDRGVSRKPKFKLLKQSFGDGYEQRIVDGINSKKEDYSVAFNNRTPAEINGIADYLDAIVPENFTVYIDEDVTEAYCEEYEIKHNHTGSYSLTATFKRVYEA